MLSALSPVTQLALKGLLERLTCTLGNLLHPPRCGAAAYGGALPIQESQALSGLRDRQLVDENVLDDLAISPREGHDRTSHSRKQRLCRQLDGGSEMRRALFQAARGHPARVRGRWGAGRPTGSGR
ncbi:MAG TPA: hypothetical protein VFH51_19305, partial [Myxococcota bacterium]|nr:hypothetical protein [Myxococcota bacterium]